MAAAVRPITLGAGWRCIPAAFTQRSVQMEKQHPQLFGGLHGGVVLLHGGKAGGVVLRMSSGTGYRAFGASRNEGEEIPS